MSDISIPKSARAKDHFEDCYLKTKCLRRSLNKTSTADIDKCMKNPEFQRVISYLSLQEFNKNSNRLLRCGFDQDDMRSIVSVFAVQFIHTAPEGLPKKDHYYLMMRFINQRLGNFMTRLDVKFYGGERPYEFLLSEPVDHGTDYNGGTLEYLDILPATAQESFPSFREEAAELRATIKEVSVEKVGSKQKANHISRLREKSSALHRQIMGQSKTNNLLKTELYTNIDKYRTDLSNLAGNRFVHHDVRKKAKSLCRKYGINYTQAK